MYKLIKSTLPLGGIFDINVLNKKLNNLKEKTSDPTFWSNNKKASTVLKNISRIEKEIKLKNKKKNIKTKKNIKNTTKHMIKKKENKNIIN